MQGRDALRAVAIRVENAALLGARSLKWRPSLRRSMISPAPHHGAQIRANSDTRGLPVELQEDIEPGYVDAAGVWRPLF
jgi:hypothetical protein